MTIPFPFIAAYILFLAVIARLAINWHRLAKKQRPEALFKEPHTARDIYTSLLNLDPLPPQHILSSALIARGMETLKRNTQLQKKKQALSKLWSQGLIGPELLDSLLMAENEIALELKELEDEAKAYGIHFKSFPKIILDCCENLKSQALYWKIPKQIEDLKRIDEPES